MHVGGWEVVGEIERGAVACLYEGRSAAGDAIAVEVLLPEPALDAATRARFLRGAGVQAGLRHPSLVRVHAAGDGPPAPFVVCDLHAGPHLADRLRAGELEMGAAVDQLGDVAEALDALHAAGYPHGAVQPDAILGDGTHALLTSVGRGGAGLGGLVAEAFRAPELTPLEPATPAADRFALAGILFLALTGGLPFAAPPLEGTAQARTGGRGKAARRRRARAEAVADGAISAAGDIVAGGGRTPTPVQALRPELPAALDAVFARALAPEPDARPETAEAVVEAVRTALGAEGLALEPAPATAALGLPSRAAGPGPTLETVNGTNGHSPQPAEPTAVLTKAPPVPEPIPAVPPGREDDRAIAAVRYVRAPPTLAQDWKPPRRGGWFRRLLVRLLAFVWVVAAAGAIAFFVLHFVDKTSGGANDAAPPLPNGLYTLGSALEPGGVSSRDCLDRSASGGSPACSVLQVSLLDAKGKGRRLNVGKPSTIRAWAVRGAAGPMSIQVVRRVGGKTRQISRSKVVDVPDTGVHRYQTSLTIQPGDLVALDLGQGARMGVRRSVTGALTERWVDPALGPTPRAPSDSRSSGFAYEVMLRLDLATKSSEAKKAAG